MSESAATNVIDWSKFRLTRLRVFAGAACLLVVSAVVTATQLAASTDHVFPAGSPVGGDYVAFYAAGALAIDGAPGSAYDAAAFRATLEQVGPPIARYGLTWQYPPAMFLIVAPLAFVPFLAGYFFWSGAAAAAWLATLNNFARDRLALFIAAASPSAFHAFTTGQNGFLTAALLGVAALAPDRRPVLAGLAAAFLTIKPQFGLLIPIAYAAGGCWRAFGVAATGSLVLAVLSTAAFGAGIWGDFLGGLGAASQHLSDGVMPLFKMATPYAFARFAGASATLATAIQITAAIAAAALVFRVWRRTREADLRAAVLCVGVFFAAPYGYYYELVILALPVIVIAARAQARGWLAGEQASLAAMFLLPLALPGAAAREGIAIGFVCVLLVACGVLRRLAADAPGIFAIASPAPGRAHTSTRDA